MKLYLGILIVALTLLMLPDKGKSRPREQRSGRYGKAPQLPLQDMSLKSKLPQLSPRSPGYGRYGYGYHKGRYGYGYHKGGYRYGYGRLHDKETPKAVSPLEDMLPKRKSASETA